MEMGGYLPLELVKGKNWFSDIQDENKWALNTGRTAIWAAIVSMHPQRLFVPYYYCPDVIEMIRSLRIPVSFYHITEDLLPDKMDLQSFTDRDGLILVDYFGILHQQLVSWTEQFPNIIFDFCHSFYTAPIMKDGVYNVYSCRKFFGVGDGAYLIAKNIEKCELEQDSSSSRSLHLLISLEKGTNAAYQENKSNEAEIGKEHLTMSVLTEAILNGTDYERVAFLRNRNYSFLRNRLSHLQKLSSPSGENIIPYCFPLLLDKDIHGKLVERKIYTAYLWKWLHDSEWNGTIEQRYSMCLLPLPLDQRYSESDLEWMCRQIEEVVSEE